MNREKGPTADHSQLIRHIGQIVIALLGSAGAWYFGEASSAPTRVAVGAEVLFWVCGAALVAVVIAAVYPVAMERQVGWLARKAVHPIQSYSERRRWNEWIEHWKHLSLLIVAVRESDAMDEAIRERQPAYSQQREWLLDNRHALPKAAIKHVRWHLRQRFNPLSKNDEAIDDSSGLVRFFRDPTLRENMVQLLLGSEDSTWGKPQHGPVSSLGAIWEGLSDFAVARHWSPLGRLEL